MSIEPNSERLDSHISIKDCACFLCTDHDQADLETTVAIADVCSRCGPKAIIDASSNQRVLEHMAAHIQHDPTVTPSQELCGLCLHPSPMCQIFLKKQTGVSGSYSIDYNRSNCPNFSTVHQLRYSHAAKSTALSPCSNVPIICPLCPNNAATVWTHFIGLHFTKRHNLKPDMFPIKYRVSSSEKTALQEIWSKRFDKQKRWKGGRGKQGKHPLVISQEHRSIQVTTLTRRYVHCSERFVIEFMLQFD